MSAFELIPVFRLEEFVDAVVNGTTPPVPYFRDEYYLAKAAGANVDIPTPVTREEMYLASIAGEDVTLPYPVLRDEFYLAKIAGMDVEVPEPITRAELVLNYWAENSGGGLPAGYEKYAGFQFNGSQKCYVTGFKLTGDDTVRVDIKPSTAGPVFGATNNTSAANCYSLWVSTTQGSKDLCYNGGKYSSYFPAASLNQRMQIAVTPTGSQGIPGGDDTWEQADFTTSVDLCIGSRYADYNGSYFQGIIYGNFVVDGRFNGIPCKRLSDDKTGYYDTFSETLYSWARTAPTPITE